MTRRVGSGPPPVGEEDLQAYVDGQLDAAHRADIEAFLAAHPQDAARVEAYRRQNIAFHALFDDDGDDDDGEVCPAAAPGGDLQQRLAAALARQRRLRRTAGLAACTALIAGIGALGWWGPATDGWRGGGDRVAAAAPELAAAVLEHPYPPGTLPAATGAAPADGGTATATAGTGARQGLGAWLAERLAGGESEEWPDLRPLGLYLVAERLSATADGLAVQLAYEDDDGRAFALHIELSADESPIAAPPPVREGEVALFWRSGRLVVGLVGEAQREELLLIADAVAAQLAPVGAIEQPPGAADQDLAVPPVVVPDSAAPGADDPTGAPPPGAPKPEVVQEAGVDGAVVVGPAPDALAAEEPDAAAGGGGAGDTAPAPGAATDAGGSRPLSSGLTWPGPGIERA